MKREPVVFRCVAEYGADSLPVDEARLREAVARQHGQIIAQLRDSGRLPDEPPLLGDGNQRRTA